MQTLQNTSRSNEFVEAYPIGEPTPEEVADDPEHFQVWDDDEAPI